MNSQNFVAAAVVCACLTAAAPPATAQEAAEEAPEHEVMELPPAREAMPNTDACPQATAPPQPMTTSEAVTTGTPPPPLPVSYTGFCGVLTPAGYNVGDKVLASSWLVADIDTGEVIAMKDPHGRYRPASIIKVLLALVAIEELPLDKEIIVSDESAAQEGSAVGLGAHGRYSVNDLLHGLLMASGNDAAHALAQELGGDDMALRKVNALAQRLNMGDTRAASYSGLDKPGMSTSAWDIGLAYRAAFDNPVFAGIVDTQSYQFPGYDDVPSFEVWNDNLLYLNDSEGIGGKTGFTDDANHTFVGAVNHEGRRLVAVLLDTTVDRGRAWEQAQQLLQEAYRFPNSAAVATLLTTVAGKTEAATPDGSEEPAVVAADIDATTIPWAPISIVALVIVVAIGLAWFSRVSQATPGRHR